MAPEHFRPEMAQVEKDLAKRWHAADGKAPSEITTLLTRNKSTITRLLKSKGRPCAQGRPESLSPTQIGNVAKRLAAMVKVAQGQYRVTANMVTKDMRLKCSVRTILTTLHKQGIYFRPMRQKPLLTDQYVINRMAFANKYAMKPADWWLKNVHLTIDGKYFKVFLGQDQRTRAAKEGTWGAFRTKKAGVGGSVCPSLPPFELEPRRPRGPRACWRRQREGHGVGVHRRQEVDRCCGS